MVLVSEECTKILNCRVVDLRDRLRHPIDAKRVQERLMGRWVRATYPNRQGMHKTFKVAGLTRDGADSLSAYGRLPKPFNVCVAAHFYSRHRLRLIWPYNPCVIERTGGGKEGEHCERYVPIELVELVDSEDESTKKPDYFKSVGPNKTTKKPFWIVGCGDDGDEEDGDGDKENSSLLGEEEEFQRKLRIRDWLERIEVADTKTATKGVSDDTESYVSAADSRGGWGRAQCSQQTQISSGCDDEVDFDDGGRVW